MRMRVGFRTVGFREWPLPRCLETLAELGYDGVELCLEHPDMRPEALTEHSAQAIARNCRDFGLDIASVSYHGDSDASDLRRDNQLRSIGLTAAMGSDLLILNTPRSDPTRPYQWHELESWLASTLLTAAEAHRVRLAFEPEPGLILNGLAEMLQLLQSLPHPRLGVNLDIGHAWLTDDDICDTIRQLAPWLWHLHFEDFPTGEHRHLPPGQGDMPLREIHETLQGIGYDGYYTIDLFNITDDPLAHARESLEATRKLL